MIVIQFDRNYFKWGVLFSESFVHFNPDLVLFIDSVNLDSNQIRKLEKISSRIIIKNSIVNFTSGNFSNFMANRKAEVLFNVMENYESKVYLLCDVDFLIRKPLTELFYMSSGYDISCIFRDGKWKGEIFEHLKIASGLILVKSSSIDFVSKWLDLTNECEKLHGIQKGKWYWDQVTLLEATRQCKLKYLSLSDDIYINREFNQFATIWSAHRSPKDYMYYLFIADFQMNKNRNKPIKLLISYLFLRPIYIILAQFYNFKYQIHRKWVKPIKFLISYLFYEPIYLLLAKFRNLKFQLNRIISKIVLWCNEK
jgi:hypothetical protein